TYPILRIENKRLIFFQIGSNKAFTCCECLLAHIIRGYATQLRFCNLDKIAKYLGVTNFEGSNSCSFALALFHFSHPLLAVLRGFLYLIKLGTIAITNNTSFRSAQWWLIYKR